MELFSLPNNSMSLAELQKSRPFPCGARVKGILQLRRICQLGSVKVKPEKNRNHAKNGQKSPKGPQNQDDVAIWPVLPLPPDRPFFFTSTTCHNNRIAKESLGASTQAFPKHSGSLFIYGPKSHCSNPAKEELNFQCRS